MSLTDRMAAALRRVIDDVSDLSNETLAVCHEALAEYDAERNPPAKPRLQSGQSVRCRKTPTDTSWHGEILYVNGRTVTVQTNDGDVFIALADELELIPNLPAPNTGD